MDRGAFALVLALAAFSAVGCGTFLNHQQPGTYFNYHGKLRPDRVYGGVRVHGEIVADTVTSIAHGKPIFSSSSVTEYDPVKGEQVTRDTTPALMKVGNAVARTLFHAVDLPLSFVADTVMLPADTYAQWKRLTAGPPTAETPKADDPPPPEGR